MRPPTDRALVHILSPFDPLIIQRKRLKLFFGYEHRFEAYYRRTSASSATSRSGPHGDEIVAALDLKTDRENGKLLIQKWTWVGNRAASPGYKRLIEEELGRFERFQLAFLKSRGRLRLASGEIGFLPKFMQCLDRRSGRSTADLVALTGVRTNPTVLPQTIIDLAREEKPHEIAGDPDCCGYFYCNSCHWNSNAGRGQAVCLEQGGICLESRVV